LPKGKKDPAFRTVSARQSVGLWSQEAHSGSTETAPERVDGSYDLPNTGMGRWTRHQVAGSRRSTPA
jgi:hypothetical protein